MLFNDVECGRSVELRKSVCNHFWLFQSCLKNSIFRIIDSQRQYLLICYIYLCSIDSGSLKLTGIGIFDKSFPMQFFIIDHRFNG